MTFVVEILGRRRTVAVQRENGRLVVTLDGAVVPVDIVQVAADDDGRWSLMAGDRSFEIAVDDRGAGDVVVHVDGHPVPVAITQAGGTWSGRKHDGHAGGDGPVRITAPMPGRVVKVLVKAGDAVVPRQGLVVVEAMKMENELRAPRAGTVREVLAAEGASVEARAVLVTIE